MAKAQQKWAARETPEIGKGNGARRAWGTDELNFAEFPLAALTDHLAEGQRSLTFEDDIFDEGARQRVHRKLVISGSDLFGLPVPLDSDVLLIAMDQTHRANGFTDRHVPFRRSELLSRLGWDDGGKSYRRLDESLQRWAGTTLHYAGSWWDRRVNRWQSQTFHVLESLSLKGQSGRNGADASLCSFTWNEIVFASFQANNIRRLDLDLYFSLERPAARRMFRFLDKRFYHSHRLEFELSVFAFEHVGYSRSYDCSQLKRKMRPAIEELEERGFLKPAEDPERFHARGRGDWVVMFEKNGRRRESRDCNAVESGGAAPIVQKLIGHGIHRDTAVQLAASTSAEAIDRQLEIFTWLKGRKDRRISRNPPGYLVAAIRGDFVAPPDFRPTGRPIRTNGSNHPPPRAARIVSNERLEEMRLDAAWNALSSDERTAVERDAMVNAGPALRQGLDRSLERGLQSTVDTYRRMIVHEHLRKRGSGSNGL